MPPKRILLIEDEDPIREIFKRQLDKAGLLTDGAQTAQAGLALLSQNHYDLLLLDIMLPDTNGLEVLKQVKQNPLYKSLPVVMLTNLGQDSVIKEGFELGADGYLMKVSYTPDQVVAEVQKILAGKTPTKTI